jgi:phosphopentomutase
MGNAYVIVVDGLGVGAQEDAAEYGDESMNTLGHVSEETGVRLPNLQIQGIGKLQAFISGNPFRLIPTGSLRGYSRHFVKESGWKRYSVTNPILAQM